MQNIGERLFVETRFAEYFAVEFDRRQRDRSPRAIRWSARCRTFTPARCPAFRRAIDQLPLLPLRGRISGRAGRRQSHLRRFHHPQPVAASYERLHHNAPQRDADGRLAAVASGPTFLHFDGEFTDPADLVETTLTGRNFGWGPAQGQQAIAHIAAVIRGDNGNNTPAAEYGCNLSYSKILLGTDPTIPADCKLPAQYRLDVASRHATIRSSDDVSAMIAQYMYGLLFKQDEYGRYYASPYDVFLRINHLPVQPAAGANRCAVRSESLPARAGVYRIPSYVDGTYGSFKYHAQPFAFGATELAGLEDFPESRRRSALTARSTPAIARPATRRRTSPISASTTQASRRRNMTRPTALAHSWPSPIPTLARAHRRTTTHTSRFRQIIPTPPKASAIRSRGQSAVRRPGPLEHVSERRHSESAGGPDRPWYARTRKTALSIRA